MKWKKPVEGFTICKTARKEASNSNEWRQNEKTTTVQWN